jgi:hypothetical protein
MNNYSNGESGITGSLISIGVACVMLCLGLVIGALRIKAAAFTSVTILTAVGMFVLSVTFGLFDDRAYNKVEAYSEGMAAYEVGNILVRRWGFIDESRSEIIPPLYTKVLSFSDGLVAVRTDKWGFIDKNGVVVVPFIYDSLGSFSEGLATVMLVKENVEKWGFINISGDEVVEIKYESVRPFSEGLAAVSYNGKWGYIDYQGSVIISLDYDRALSFSNGYAAVGYRRTTRVGNWRFNNGQIDKTGRVIVPLDYHSFAELEDNLIRVTQIRQRSGSRNDNLTDMLYGVYNRTRGEEIIPCTYRNLSIIDGRIRALTRNGDYHYYDKSGNRVE